METESEALDVLSFLDFTGNGGILSLGRPNGPVLHVARKSERRVARTCVFSDAFVVAAHRGGLKRFLGWSEDIDIQNRVLSTSDGTIVLDDGSMLPAMTPARLASIVGPRPGVIEVSAAWITAELFEAVVSAFAEGADAIVLIDVSTTIDPLEVLARSLLAAGFARTLATRHGIVFTPVRVKAAMGIVLEASRSARRQEQAPRVECRLSVPTILWDRTAEYVDEPRSAVWTQQAATRIVMFLPCPGRWDISLLIDEHSYRGHFGLGSVLHRGVELGQTNWSDEARHSLAFTADVAAEDVGRGVALCVIRPEGEGRHAARGRGVRLNGIEALRGSR